MLPGTGEFTYYKPQIYGEMLANIPVPWNIQNHPWDWYIYLHLNIWLIFYGKCRDDATGMGCDF